MAFTVVDGDFPRDVIRNENLTLSRYRIFKSRNNRLAYDARRKGPGQALGGTPVPRGKRPPKSNDGPVSWWRTWVQ